jgi:hypothetical protein
MEQESSTFSRAPSCTLHVLVIFLTVNIYLEHACINSVKSYTRSQQPVVKSQHFHQGANVQADKAADGGSQTLELNTGLTEI